MLNKYKFNYFKLKDKFSIEHYKHHNITDEVPVVDSNDNEIQSIHLSKTNLIIDNKYY